MVSTVFVVIKRLFISHKYILHIDHARIGFMQETDCLLMIISFKKVQNYSGVLENILERRITRMRNSDRCLGGREVCSWRHLHSSNCMTFSKDPQVKDTQAIRYDGAVGLFD